MTAGDRGVWSHRLQFNRALQPRRSDRRTREFMTESFSLTIAYKAGQVPNSSC